jgi:hypothetical protein
MATNETKTTIDHNEIRKWVEAHRGFPAAVSGSGSGDLGENFDPGVLRIDLPGAAGEEELTPVSWEDWFAKFDREELAFVSQERKAGSAESAFYELVTD